MAAVISDVLHGWVCFFQGEVGDLVYHCSKLGDTGGDMPTNSFRLLGGSQSASTRRLIRSQNLKQQLGKYTVKSILGRNREMNAVLSVLSHGRE